MYLVKRSKYLTYLSEEPHSEVHNADKYLIEMQSYFCSA